MQFVRRSFVNKAELIAAVAEKTGFTKKDAEASVAAFIATVQESLVAGDKVQLIGFGTFETRERKARTGRNPRKPDEIMEIPASIAPAFKPGKALKDAVNK
ncbi:MAG: HU family DNA-binding protein [Clostridiales Family XIII bacterium]|nr:HU family DNA-binding protein [Clostridiales Family XIII bacterium]